MNRINYFTLTDLFRYKMDTERVKELKTFTNDFNLKLKNAFDQFNNNVYSLINILG